MAGGLLSDRRSSRSRQRVISTSSLPHLVAGGLPALVGVSAARRTGGAARAVGAAGLQLESTRTSMSVTVQVLVQPYKREYGSVTRM